MALQWVTDYDLAMTRGGSSPEDHAKRRQFRFAGVIKWKMGEIIASLPLLLYSSVALFAAGGILWMLSICPLVGYLASGLSAIAVLFYVVTTLLAATFASAPYRTQLSRGLYWLSRVTIQRFIRSIWILALMLSFVLLRAYSAMTPAIGIFIPAVRRSRPQNEVLFQQIRLPTLLRFSKTISLHEQERQEAERNPWLREEALAWLERQLPRSVDSHGRLLMLLKELINHTENHKLSPQLFEISWWGLFDSLGWHYMQQILSSRLKKAEYEGLEALIRCSSVPAFRKKLTPGDISPGLPYENNPENGGYWEQCCLDTTDIVKAKPDALNFVNMAFLLTRDIPTAFSGSKIEIKATVKLIKWRNSTEHKHLEVWRDIFANSEQYSTIFRQSCLRQFSRVVVGASLSATGTGMISTGVAGVAFLVLGPPQITRPDVASIFSVTIDWALDHAFTREESSALAHAFESWITQQPLHYTEEFLPENIIRRPLHYGKFIRNTVGERVKDMHYSILVLVARTVISLPKPDQAQWVKWVLMMLWLASPGPEVYWDCIVQKSNDGESTSAVQLWQRIDCRYWIGSADNIPHIEEIVQIIGGIIGDSEDVDLIWVGSTEVGERRCQLVRIVEAFDRIFWSDSAPELHVSLVRLLSRDMNRLEDDWTSSELCEGHIRHYLPLIRDPCLALLGRFASDIGFTVNAPLTKEYIDNHTSSLTLVQSLVYKNVATTDPPSFWWLRASLLPLGGTPTVELLRGAFRDVQQLVSGVLHRRRR
jgi:hypothetical protein